MTQSLVDIGKISAPLTKFIEVIGHGVGALHKPYGIVSEAKAEAKAMVIKANAQSQVSDIEYRTYERLNFQEIKRQRNIEKITDTAVLQLPETVSEEKLSDDWIAQFFDYAKDVNDDDVQILWAKILAGEVAQPNSYSTRLLHFLKSMDKWEAEKFTQFCSFILNDKKGWGFILSDKNTLKEMRNLLGEGDYFQHFITIGLLGSEAYWIDASKATGRNADYFETSYQFQGPPAPQSKIGIAGLEPCLTYNNLTSIGQQLLQISGRQRIDGYIERTSDALYEELKIRIESCLSINLDQ